VILRIPEVGAFQDEVVGKESLLVSFEASRAACSYCMCAAVVPGSVTEVSAQLAPTMLVPISIDQ
jgi:hypothetical protein